MKNKLAAKEAIEMIQHKLKAELNLIHLDNADRSKAHGFAAGEHGKQFVVILGNSEGAQQTRIITEKLLCLPDIADVTYMPKPYKGSRVNQQMTSRGYKNNLFNGNQTSFIVDNLSALDKLIRWYVTGNFDQGI